MAESSFPVQLTERSAAAIRQILPVNSGTWNVLFLRITSADGGFQFAVTSETNPESDLIGESFGIKLVVRRQDQFALSGYVIDYRSVGPQKGFCLKDPGSLHSRASDPGRFQLSDEKLRRLHPELYPGWRGFFGRLLGRVSESGLQEFQETITEHLQNGDSRAAVVAALKPLVVAAYTDELDCVALLRFPDHFTTEYRLNVGSRLLTVNMYSKTEGGKPASDLVPGQRDTGRWMNFFPHIADFLVQNVDQVEGRKRIIGEDEWARATDLATEQLVRGVTPRDGRPLYCGQPASA